MAHDGQDLPKLPLLPGLLGLIWPALAEIEAHLATARAALADRVVMAGKASAEALEVHQ